MARFVVMAKGTIEGRKNIAQAKQNFIAVSKLFKAKDSTILNAYAVMGNHDYMFITEAPDLPTAFELSAMIGTMGALVCETYPIMPLEELFEMV